MLVKVRVRVRVRLRASLERKSNRGNKKSMDREAVGAALMQESVKWVRGELYDHPD